MGKNSWAQQPSYPTGAKAAPPSPPCPPSPPPSPLSPPTPPSMDCMLQMTKGDCGAKATEGCHWCTVGSDFGVCLPQDFPCPGSPPSSHSPPSPPSPPSPSGKHYEDPQDGCSSDEVDIKIQGVGGAVCAP